MPGVAGETCINKFPVFESAKLRALLAHVLYVPCVVGASVPHVLRVICGLAHQVPRSSRGFVPHVSLVPRALYARCSSRTL